MQRAAPVIDRWIAAISNATPDVPLSRFAETGQRLLRDHHPEVLLDPAQRQTLERVVERLRGKSVIPQYASREELVADLSGIARYGAVLATRQPLVQDVTAAINRAHMGERGFIVLSGESGIGKTFLWRSVVAQLPEDTRAPFYFKAPQARAGPLAVVQALVSWSIDAAVRRASVTPYASVTPRTSVTDPGAEAERTSIVERVLRENRASAQVDDLVRRLAHISVSGRAEPGTVAPHMHNDVIRGVAHTLTALTDISGDRIVIAVDDLQWIDDDSLGVLRAIRDMAPRWALVLIGRPEIRSRLRIDEAALWREVPPVSTEEGRLILSALDLPSTERALSAETVEWAVAQSRGNPFALVETVRAARQWHNAPGNSTIAHDRERSIIGRLHTLSPDSQFLTAMLALVAPPVSRSFFQDAGFAPNEITDWIDESSAAMLVEVAADGETITFPHDQIEHAIYHHVVALDDLLPQAIRMLLVAAENGDENARYALATKVSAADAPGIGGDTGEGALDRVAVQLALAAEQALERLAARDAVRFVNGAVRIAERGGDLQRLVPLYRLGHQAAFLADDGASLSWFFTRLLPHSDVIARNELREWWVTRCFAHLWIAGAWQIGWRIFRELDAIPADGTLRRIARRKLRPRAIAPVNRAMGSASRLPDDRVRLIGRTAIRMVMPALSIDPDAVWDLAWIVIGESIVSGIGVHSVIGYAYWGIALAENGARYRTLVRLRRHARAVFSEATRRVGPVYRPEQNLALVYTTILIHDWRVDTSRLAEELHAFYEQGMRIGDYEGAAQAISLYGQINLMHGAPLADVFSLMEGHRTVLINLGQERTAASIAKYQQAVEVLMGNTDDPVRLTGSIVVDSEVESHLIRRSDRMALAGFYAARLLLAVVHAAPQEALNAFDQLRPMLTFLTLTFEANALWFLHGMAASQCGEWGRVRETVRELHPFRRAPAGAHRHMALRAVAQARRAYGTRRARELFRRAVDTALRNGYPHEAALIAERSARNTGDRAHAELAVHLFTQWGARRAVERTRAWASSRRGPVKLRTAEPATTKASDAEAPPTHSLNILFATIPDALMLITADGAITVRNKAAREYVAAIGIDSEVLATPVLSALRHDIQIAHAERHAVETEREIQGRVLEVIITPLPRGNEQRRDELVLIARDVTAARERQRQLIVSDRMSSLGMLASTVAHEVSNPNHIVQLNAQALELRLAQMTVDPQVTTAVHHILEGSRRIDTVVRHVMDYGREGRAEEWEELDPVAICERVIQFTRLLVARTSDGVVLTRVEPLPRALGVRALIEQALINLVKNAAEAVERRDAEIAVVVDAHDEFLSFSVCDQGRGMAYPERPGPFTTSRAAEGGTGLGLSIVQSIAELHRGAIHFSTSDQYATIAELTIPRVVEPGTG